MLAGFGQDLAAEATRTSDRTRGLLTQFHPGLEHVLGPRPDQPAVTWLPERYGAPAAPREAGHRKPAEVIRPKAPRMARRLIDEVFDALDEQTVVVPGTGALDLVTASLARSLTAVHAQRRALEAQIGQLLEAHPLARSIPRSRGSRSGPPPPRWSPSATAPASPPLPTRPPTPAPPRPPSRRGPRSTAHTHPSAATGNRNARCPCRRSPQCATPASRTYYDRCRARGRTHTQALLRPARRRINVPFAMLRDGMSHEPTTPRLA
ncbi:hypothetical protein GCM10010259_50190 [Streptomyces daghestanicus]|uniref:Transposase n=1 Tax=Streptomyces daghestanicus TaxID=66885 RepID=A0ABQ3PVV9_9ACTN|nr:hypothetical protein GCM10010240_48520 [Streptomyces griseoviridis]GGU52869.1 hypothetical protein GCM10010259_50190 [Streptomyces daghestanicus]GHI29158.1 hypothetical protein Sdagh_08880 [Streptomyces daghestanicus]